MHTRWTKI